MTSRKLISDGRAGGVLDAPEPARPGGRQFAERFIGCMVFWGFIGLLLSSRFPVCLGAVLFLTDDEFIEWVLQKIGIRFVPDAVGPEFIKFFAFMTGWAVLLGYWNDSVPAWLSPWIPPTPSWPLIAAGALSCAALDTLSAAIARRLLPRVGIEIPPRGLVWITAKAPIFFGVLALLVSAAMVAGWL